MSHYQGDDGEYVADDYEAEDVDDDGEFRGRELADPESDVDEVDISGIPWERHSITREKYRQTRLEQYKNYENVPQSGEKSWKDCTVTEKGNSFYEFRRNSRSLKSTILHF